MSRADERDGPYGDQDRIADEAPAAPIGGMWFTADDSAPGGVRPLTEAEYRAVSDQVATGNEQAHVRADLTHADQQIEQARHDLVVDEHGEHEPGGYCRTGDYMISQLDGTQEIDGVDDGWDDQR